MSVYIQDDRTGGFMDESKSQERRVELEKFLQCVKGNRRLGNALCAIRTMFYRDEKPVKWDEMTAEESVSVEGLLEKMVGRIFSGEQEVNGKKGEWSNGCFGSRWYDDRNKHTTCRVAFYSRKSSTEWKSDKSYMMSFTFESRPANHCGNPECDNKGHGYKKCSACWVRRYCSTECQRTHWKEHKSECQEFQDLDKEDETDE
jgi:hypothetical protein